MKRRPPTKDQWFILRNVLGNGWGDGDYLEYGLTLSEKRKIRRAMVAFEQWLEDRYNIKFSCPLT